MNHVQIEWEQSLRYWLILNRPEKNNAFNPALLNDLHEAFKQAIDNPQTRVIILKANGAHFSAGADIAWMQEMIAYDAQTNIKDSLVLGQLMHQFISVQNRLSPWFKAQPLVAVPDLLRQVQ